MKKVLISYILCRSWLAATVLLYSLLHILTANKNCILPAQQLRNCRAELNLCSPEMVCCLHTKHNQRLLRTQQALLKKGGCFWFPWCTLKWHFLPSAGESPGWLQVRVAALQTSLCSEAVNGWDVAQQTGKGQAGKEKNVTLGHKRGHIQEWKKPPVLVLSHKYSSFPRQQQVWRLLWISRRKPTLASLCACLCTSLPSLLRATTKAKHGELSAHHKVFQQISPLSNTPTFTMKPREHTATSWFIRDAWY